MKKKQKYFFKLILLLFVINIFYSCKKASHENIQSTYLKDDKTIYNEIKTLDITSNYSEEPVKGLNIKFQDYDFKIKYIEERAYIQYSLKNKTVSDWQPLNINFFYDSSYEFAEKDIHVLYNSSDAEGILLLPSFTEEYTSYFVYQFNSEKLQFVKDIELPTNLSNFTDKTFVYQASKKNKNLNISFLDKNNKEYLFTDRDFNSPLINSNIKKKDFALITGENTDNSVIGSWQLDCATPNSGLEIFQNKENLGGIIAVAPPAIFIEFNLEKGKEADTYYIKYLAQDMSSPLASENEIDETNISKNESIGKIVKNKGGIDLIWYGIYDTKSKKRINVISQFNTTDNPQTIKLVKCKTQ